MRVKVRLQKGKYRVVEATSGHIAKTSKNTVRDGGGHESKEKAERQARAINAVLAWRWRGEG